MFVGRAMSRRTFLVLGGMAFTGVVFSSVARCGGEEEGSSGVTITLEPAETGELRQTAEISTPRGTVRGVLYPVEDTRGAVLMVRGAGGDTIGPAGIYEELATRLQAGGAEALRLEYRTPNHLDECVYDLLAGIEALGQREGKRVILVGWSFGGAVVISAGATNDAVIGVTTVASQMYGAQAVGELSPEKSLLLIHGTADTVLPYELSERLYAQAGEPKDLVLYPDDGHDVERHRLEMLEKLHEWSRNLLFGDSETRAGEGWMADWGFVPFAVSAYDNPETIRLRKYVTGAHFVLQGVGIETGRTPREVVWEKGKARLYRYGTDDEKRFAIPVLLVYALILRPYVLDLVPGNSLVEYLFDEGFDVYLLDWGVPDGEDSDLSFENYVLDYMPEAVEGVLATSGAGGLTIFGYCQGGTMSVIYAALSPRAPPTSLVLLATPTDFAPDDPGLLGLWTYWSRQGYFDPNLLIGPSGNVPADEAHRFVEGAAGAPLGGYLGGYANPWGILARGRPTKSFLAVSKWVDDGVPFPGAAFRQWVRDFYQQNKLVSGELELRGHRVDMSEISCPILNIAGRKDYICPESQARATMDLLASEDKEFLVLDAGHVGLMCSPMAREELWPRVRHWLEPRSN